MNEIVPKIKIVLNPFKPKPVDQGDLYWSGLEINPKIKGVCILVCSKCRSHCEGECSNCGLLAENVGIRIFPGYKRRKKKGWEELK